MGYLAEVGAALAILVTQVAGLSLVSNTAGQPLLAQAGASLVGAYTCALASTALSPEVPWIWFLAGSSGAVFGAIASAPSARLQGDYYALATIAVQLIATSLFANLSGWTGGVMGVPNIPGPQLAGYALVGWQWTALLLLGMACAMVSLSRIRNSNLGLLLRAIKEDEFFVASAGHRSFMLKLRAGVVAGAFGGVGGAMIAQHRTFVEPFAFALPESIALLTTAYLAQRDTAFATIGASAVVLAVPEALRFMGVWGTDVALLRQFVFGSILIFVAWYRPRG